MKSGKKLSILLISATYPPSTNGVAVLVGNVFSELTRRGMEVYLLAPEGDKKVKDPKNIIRYPSVPNPYLKDYRFPLLPLNQKIIQLLTKKRFDIVHAHHPFQISFMADVVSSLNNIPFIYTYHTFLDKYIGIYLKFLPKKLTSFIASYTGTGVFGKADLIIVPSKSVKRRLSRFGVKKNIVVLPVGTPKFESPKESKQSLRKKYGLPLQKTCLLCVSRIGKEKNLKLLVDSMKYLPEKYVLVIAGMGPYMGELKNLVKKKNLENRVFLIGKVVYSKINEVYCLGDIFVFPSLTETQGLVFLEASYFGLPTVAVESAVNREWVRGEFGIVSKNIPKDFATAILKASKNKSQLGKKAKQFAASFTIDKTTKELINIYQNTISSYNQKKPLSLIKERFFEFQKHIIGKGF